MEPVGGGEGGKPRNVVATEVRCTSWTMKRKRGDETGQGESDGGARERERQAEGARGGDSDEGKQEGADPGVRREAKRPKREGQQSRDSAVADIDPGTPQAFAWEEDTLPIELVEDILDRAAYGDDDHMYVVFGFVRRQWRSIVPTGPDEYFVLKAIEARNLPVLRWAVGLGCPLKEDYDGIRPCEAAAESGDGETLRWLLESAGALARAQTLTLSLSHRAAIWGNVSALGWMVRAGHPIHPRACLAAAVRSKWDAVELMASRPGEWLKLVKVCYRLALGRRLDLLRLVLSNGRRIGDAALCVRAARHNDLDTLMWLRAGGFGWDESVCHLAVVRENLEMFKWAVRSGCPCDTRRCFERMSSAMGARLLQECVAIPSPSCSTETQPPLAAPAHEVGAVGGVASEKMGSD